MTTRVLPRRENFPTHGPWDRDGSVPGHRKWSGCKKNPGKNGVQGVQKCTEGCTGGHGAWVGARLARVSVHVCAKVGMVEIGCGGYLGGTPPIGKLELLGLISGEKVLQDGWQGQTDTSKCRNAARFRMHACTCMHGVLEGDGRWWWALNGCTNQLEGWPLGPVVGQTAPGAGMAGMDGQVQMQRDLVRDGVHMHASEMLPGVAGEWWWASNECASLPKEGPLGPVLKQSHSRLWVTRWVTASKCGNVTRFGTCMAAPGCRKIDKMLNGKVYGGHIMVHHPWGKWLLGQCAYAGTL